MTARSSDGSTPSVRTARRLRPTTHPVHTGNAADADPAVPARRRGRRFLHHPGESHPAHLRDRDRLRAGPDRLRARQGHPAPERVQPDQPAAQPRSVPGRISWGTSSTPPRCWSLRPLPTYLCDLGVLNQCVPSLYDSRLEPGGVRRLRELAVRHPVPDGVPSGRRRTTGCCTRFNAGNDVVKSGRSLLRSRHRRRDVGLRASRPLAQADSLRDRRPTRAPARRHADGARRLGGRQRDRTKQSSEYHTVAVVGEREGGRSYFALDVTDPDTPSSSGPSPRPAPTTALVAGESWNDLGPAAPPIGPIAEADPSGVFKVGRVAARERYVVAVGGGFDPAYLRGTRHLRPRRVDRTAGVALRQRRCLGQQRPRRLPLSGGRAAQPRRHRWRRALRHRGGGRHRRTGLDGGHGPPGTRNRRRLYSNWFAARAFVQFSRQPYWHRGALLPAGGAGPSARERLALLRRQRATATRSRTPTAEPAAWPTSVPACGRTAASR